ncbi:hypothetical protein [Aurantibacter sp.]|uniref:hypothetical protein n=1 Tax=Aurantibacter sp. TaxID=2807103 RepID=UPI00326751A2
MKRLVFILLFLVGLLVHSQTPQKISYQALVRDADQNLVINKPVGLQISILQNTIDGAVVYSESHTPVTNNGGLVTIQIGAGLSKNQDFNTITWVEGPYFIETQIDPTGGTEYSIVGVSELLSVPYALHSKSAETLVGFDGDYAKKAEVVAFTLSRIVTNSDIGNTIACTTTAELTLPENFDMPIGDVINLEAHNGAILTVKAAAGVELNYQEGGTAIFASNQKQVRFGLLRKSAANAYIISGQ